MVEHQCAAFTRDYEGWYRCFLDLESCEFHPKMSINFQILVGARSKAWVCDRSLAVAAVSNPDVSMYFSLL
jgi:hypothetical protein